MNKKIKKLSGFTIIELMIALAVAAVLLALAAPSFVDTIRSNRLATQTSYFVTAINLARSEAIKRNTPVVMCKGAAGQCDSAVDWEDGWIVFADPDEDETVDAGETVRVFDALSGGSTLRTTAGAIDDLIIYLPNGRATGNGGFPNGTYSLCSADASGDLAKRSRRLIVSPSGRLRTVEGGATCP